MGCCGADRSVATRTREPGELYWRKWEAVAKAPQGLAVLLRHTSGRLPFCSRGENCKAVGIHRMQRTVRFCQARTAAPMIESCVIFPFQHVMHRNIHPWAQIHSLHTFSPTTAPTWILFLRPISFGDASACRTVCSSYHLTMKINPSSSSEGATQ